MAPQPYQSLEAELHDAFQEAQGPSAELPLMASFLGHHPGRALEIGCGSGRLLLPLRHQGFEIEGLELSAEMRAMAMQRAEAADIAVNIHAGDMSGWQPDRPYAALLAPSFTLQLADDPVSTLRHWHDWLQPGGGLYLTVFMPYAELLEEFPAQQWYDDHEATLPGGEHALLRTRHHFEEDRRLLVREHRYQIEGRPGADYSCSQRIRWQEPAEWARSLDQTGYQVERQFLDWDPDWVEAAPGPDDFNGILTFLAHRR